ncbi:PepSY domain-containing protein [Streptomyces sp. NPDC057386]|uniref:PepSY domain-containing protein n=1 Tax=unclassified Streptomyces TaxID=2593676 RepID=UPI003642FBA0
MRKRNAIAAIVVSGIMVGGAGVAMGGEVTKGSSAHGTAVQVRSDASSSVAAAPGGPGLAVSTVAEATDAVIRKVGDGRVTEVAFVQSGGKTLWRVTVDRGRGPVQVTLDAATGEIVKSASVKDSSGNCDTNPGTGNGSSSAADDDDDRDDDDDDDRDDDDRDDDDDDGPDRDGVNPSK